jgi:hypothetical protein
MKKSAITLIFLIVVSSLTLTLFSTAQSQTVSEDNIKVLSYSWYVNSEGILMVVGEIQNVGTNTIREVILEGDILTSEGIHAEWATRAWVLDLLPQQKAPFIMAFNNPQSSNGLWYAYPDITDAVFKAYKPQATTDYLYPDLQITDHSNIIDSNGTFWVNGRIKNTGTQTAKNITVVATFYNAEGTVVAVGFTEEFLTPRNLEPQGTASFKVRAFDLPQDEIPDNKKIKNYSLLIQVMAPILQGEPPANQPTLPPSSPPTAEPTQNQETGINLQTLISAIAIGIVIVAIVSSVLLVKKIKTQPPKKATPSPPKKRNP